MINFIICCSQGMSSSILMKKMQDYINEQQLDVMVKATTVERILSEECPFDILMLGPQIRFEKNRIKEKFPNKVVDVIPMKAYGRLDGSEVVKTGLQLLENNGRK